MTDQIFEYAKKKSVNIGLLLYALWSFNEINTIKAQLYHCYETMQLSEISHSSKDFNYKLTQVAVLPCDLKRKREKDIV